MITVRNRSYSRRFSDCEFAQFVSICFSGSGQCGHNSAAFAAQYSIICSEIAGQRVVRAFCFRTVRPPIRLATPPVGDEVALFSAARHSGIPETKATVTPRAFGCGCAALRASQMTALYGMGQHEVLPDITTARPRSSIASVTCGLATCWPYSASRATRFGSPPTRACYCATATGCA